jgi:UDP-N-acetylglucosamine--N-acetylmuramyl-(pentapeptide) pyrophosphoryl-undecaprenol N-acetylglucosamine transferase
VSTTLLIASGGGHLKQLHRLLPRLGVGEERAWMTFDTPLARSLLVGERVHFAPPARPHDLIGTVRDARFAADVLRRGRFDRAISTGANLAVAVLPLARARGIRSIYIESATRSQGPSLAGRILQSVPGIERYTQHEHWSSARWRYRGSVLDGYAAHEVALTEPVRRLVVTLGVNDSYPFGRLVERLSRIIPPHVEVTWQLGPSTTQGALPEPELLRLVSDADAVVAHAGTGSALSTMDCGKLPLLVPRRAAFGEHVDDHQALTAHDLRERGLAHAVEADELSWAHVEATTRWRIERHDGAPHIL